jgi:hypothetical protein
MHQDKRLRFRPLLPVTRLGSQCPVQLPWPPPHPTCQFPPPPQVYKAVLRDTGAEVAIKVQRPGIEPIILRDLYVFRKLAGLFNVVSRQRLGCDAELIVDEFGEKLLEELDYTQEARNIEVGGGRRAALEGREGGRSPLPGAGGWRRWAGGPARPPALTPPSKARRALPCAVAGRRSGAVYLAESPAHGLLQRRATLLAAAEPPPPAPLTHPHPHRRTSTPTSRTTSR